MKSNARLLPLVLLFAVGVALLSWPHDAQANLGSLVPSVTSTSPGSPVTFTGTVTNTSGVMLSMTTSSGTWTSGSVSTGETVGGIGGTVLSFTGAGTTIASTFTGTLSCPFNLPTVMVTLSQSPAPTAGPAVLTSSVTCIGAVSPTFPFYEPPFGYAPSSPYITSPYASYPSPLISQAAQLAVSASPAAIDCGASSNISVALRDSSGLAVPDGTPVTFSTSVGTVSPTTSSTLGGSAQAVFTASAGTNGTATITAVAGVATGYATVLVNCGSVSAPASSYPVPYAPPYGIPPIAGVSSLIFPPNTGDGGLARETQLGLIPIGTW